ncbi:sugar O-acyltransferase, sialic acid O-acetyltransferase NeuD family [Flavobacterium fryxellicola]|uniref:Hexapeptide transferase n=1 Tax=Flavobacterium fryxellicola TaxID=249352 RepID=A0A167V1L7_9FLAO|nr:acetyltransferase [Flavobacterium fryxellicola]OAB25997.1 hexapeptide transferase [Flavobacterium fryxellicola]SHN69474.1 sugar O-acyltransferase, sialic acid O-acetyltransferase NeuD family [Flavobacterium fryxellicola]
MLIIGAKGFAKEVLEILHQNGETENLCFYDDINADVPEKLYDIFPVLKSLEEAKKYFKNIDCHFTLGIGNPELRFKLFQKFTGLGGTFISTVSQNAEIGHFGIQIAEGCNILAGVKVSNDVTIGVGTMIYYNSVITHDVTIGKFCEISPDVKLLGRCKIEDFVKIGSGAVILPDVRIGKFAIVAAGSVVRNNVPTSVMVAGIPAQIKKMLKI